MTSVRGPLIGLAVSGVAVLANQAVAYEAGPVANGGSIAGMVKYRGTPPVSRKLEVKTDKEVCAVKPRLAQDLVVGENRGVKYALVSIVSIERGKPFDGPKAFVDQKGCEFLPRLQLVPAGAEVELLNSDGLLHNIHTHSERNAPVNITQPAFKKKLALKFDKPEIVKLTCDVHNWMTGWIAVQEHPYYAVTDALGVFQLPNVPAGDYELRAWHEKLGEVRKVVTVRAGAETRVKFKLPVR